MTPELANEYVKRRMRELGYGDNYRIRFRHFVLGPLEERKIDARLQLLILAVPKECIRIQSDMGVFDVAEFSTNELQYEHKGSVQLTNYSPIPQQVQMIQVIFKSK